MRNVLLFLLFLFISCSLGEQHFSHPQIVIRDWPYGKKAAFSFTCDDVSAGYDVDYIKELKDILEQYDVFGTFFVIPYHGRWDLLSRDVEWITQLRKAEGEGHEIALHGYSHAENEFLGPKEKQKYMLEEALAIMRSLGFNPVGFRAPDLRCTEDTYALLAEEDFLYSSSVFCLDGKVDSTGNLAKLCSGHDYTWYLSKEKLEANFTVAKNEFDGVYTGGGFFPMVTHLKAVNTESGISFLKRFLAYASGKGVWFAPLRDVVQWKKEKSHVDFRIVRRNIGYDIEFRNVPRGLRVEIFLEYGFFLKRREGTDFKAWEDEKGIHYEITFKKEGNVTLEFIHLCSTHNPNINASAYIMVPVMKEYMNPAEKAIIMPNMLPKTEPPPFMAYIHMTSVLACRLAILKPRGKGMPKKSDRGAK